MTKSLSPSLLLLASSVFALNVNATVIHDEAVDGDLAGGNGVPLGTLAAGSHEIVGSLDGGPAFQLTDGSDEFDSIAFSTTGDWTVDVLSVSGQTLFLNLVTGVFVDVAQASTNGARSNVLGVHGAGSWVMDFIPLDNRLANNYTVRINVRGGNPVPEPGSLLLMGVGLAGLTSQRRRVG